MGTLPWASGGGSGDGTEVGFLLDDEWVPRADRNPTPGVPCMLPLGLEAPGGTRKEDQLGTRAGPSEMGTEHVILNTCSSRGHRWYQRAPSLWYLLLTKSWVGHGLRRTASEQIVLCDKEKERPLPLPRARGASLPSFCNYL